MMPLDAARGAPAVTTPVWGLPVPLPPAGPLPRRAAVVIVGAGITGVALLQWLRARDVDAVVLERDLVGSGASGRNAGFLLAGVAENYASAVARYGRRVAADVWAFTQENHALVAAGEAISRCDYRRGGSWTIAVDREDAAALDESAVLLAEDGFSGRLLTTVPAGALRVLASEADGEVDPLRLVQSIAEPHASRIHEQTAVVAVEDGDGGASVHTADGAVVEASTVVLATNAWTSQLVPTVDIRPVRAQMLAAAGAGADVPCPAYAERGHRYWRRLQDGTLLVGGFRHRAIAEEVGYGLTPTAVVQGHLETQLRDLGARGAVVSRWCGTMGFSVDGLPLAGRPVGSRSILVCGGYTGHGMGFAVHATKVLAAHLLDAAPLPPWLDSARAVPGN
jgi:gamma-glutamylputrescine oxidase